MQRTLRNTAEMKMFCRLIRVGITLAYVSSGDGGLCRDNLWPETALCTPSSCHAFRNEFEQETKNGSKSRQGVICRKEIHAERTWAGQSKPPNPVLWARSSDAWDQTECFNILECRGCVSLGLSAPRQGANHPLLHVSKYVSLSYQAPSSRSHATG